MKTTYNIKESTHVNSRVEGDKIEATSLTQAKRHASRNKIFQGTTLRIDNSEGVCLAYKEPGCKWVDSGEDYSAIDAFGFSKAWEDPDFDYGA